MISLDHLLNEYGKKAVDLIKSKVPVVTGKTRDSVRYEVVKGQDKISLLVFGRPFFKAVETGRGPYKQGGYQEFDKKLDEWLRERGFPSKVSKKGITYYLVGDQWMSGKSLAYLINKRGDSKYRSGGVDVYSNELNVLIEQLKQDIPQEFKKGIKV